MSYATKQDMIDRFGEDEIIGITDRANPPAEVIDDDVLAKALADASAEVDSYIGLRVVTPVTPVPGDLVNRTCIIARYRLSNLTEGRTRNDFLDTIKFLTMVGAGNATLGDVALRATGGGGGGSPQISAPARTFTKDTLRDL